MPFTWKGQGCGLLCGVLGKGKMHQVEHSKHMFLQVIPFISIELKAAVPAYSEVSKKELSGSFRS